MKDEVKTSTQHSPDWFQTAVFYELYIRAFCDSNGDGHGDLPGATSKLDYVKSLGVDAIWILPHYPSPLKDDGYDVADYYNVHPDYGTLEDFKTFVQEAHRRGLKVITDLVVNHTSDQHTWFQSARQDKNSPYRNYYVWSDTGTEYSSIRLVFPDFEPSNWTYDETAGQYFWHRFYRTQPDLNFENPAVQEEILNIMRFWFALGVDGFRLDAVLYLYEQEGSTGAGLPETHAFMQRMRQLVDEEYPGRVLIAEANDWPKELMACFGESNECHMCFHFPLMPRLYMAIRQENRQPIVDIINQTPTLPPHTQWLTFLRNHDELTLEMVTPEERKWMWEQYAPEPDMRINLGIRRRLAPLLNHHKGQWLILNSLLVSLMGTPIIYYGDEIGLGDNVALPDRHGCRTPMQWSDEVNGGFSPAETTYFPVNPDYKKVNVASQEIDPNSFLNATRFLLSIRREHPELQAGELEWFETDNKAVLGYWRVLGDQRTLCLYNLSADVQSVSLHLPQFPAGKLIDLLHAGQSHSLTNYFPAVLKMRPFASHWLYWDKG